jgi:hypothetical protein
MSGIHLLNVSLYPTYQYVKSALPISFQSGLRQWPASPNQIIENKPIKESLIPFAIQNFWPTRFCRYRAVESVKRKLLDVIAQEIKVQTKNAFDCAGNLEPILVVGKLKHQGLW